MGLDGLRNPNLIVKRKFRWTLSINTPCQGVIPEYSVKLASRPNFTVEETELNFLHGKMYIPGKVTWETITVTFYDFAGRGVNGIGSLYSWLATVYNFTKPQQLHMMSRKGSNEVSGYSGHAILNMYDGCGETIEQWILSDCWPQSVNFGDLDYASSEEATVEVTLRYSEVEYINTCGTAVNPCACVGC